MISRVSKSTVEGKILKKVPNFEGRAEVFKKVPKAVKCTTLDAMTGRGSLFRFRTQGGVGVVYLG